MFAIQSRDVCVMDGSMGRLCMLKGVPEDTNLWSARGLIEERYHEIIVEAHVEYIQAGAVTLTTNNYAVQPHYYGRVFEDWEERIPKDTRVAAELAVEARRRCGAEASVRILGCLPPICESHRPDLTAAFIAEHGEAFCMNYYKVVAIALLEGGVDALLGETLNSWHEARLLIEATKDLGVPLLISMEGALRDERMKSQPETAPLIAQELLKAKESGAPIEALGLNCAPPEAIVEALDALEESGLTKQLREAGVDLVAYANSNDRKAVHDAGFDVNKFKSAGPIRVREDLKGSDYVRWCRKFADRGAKFCGGCCGTTPVEIRELTQFLTQDSSDAVVSDITELPGKHRAANDASVSTVASEAERRASIESLFGAVV